MLSATTGRSRARCHPARAVNSLDALVRAVREAKPCRRCQPPGQSNLELAHTGSVLWRAARCEDCLVSVVRAVERASMDPTAVARAAALRSALVALKEWIQSDHVRGLTDLGALHGAMISAEGLAMCAAAWAEVEAALALPAGEVVVGSEPT